MTPREEERLNTWGTIPVGASQMQIRHMVLWLGFAAWFTFTIAATQAAGIISFAFNVTFLIALILIAIGTRSISLHKMLVAFLSGGLSFGVLFIATLPLVPWFEQNPGLRPFVIVPVEELMKILPVLVLFWRERKFNSWTVGATDLLLMAAASGTGFSFALDAYAHKMTPANHFFVLLPNSEVVNGYLNPGTAIFPCIAAGTLGLAWLFRHTRNFWKVTASVGFIIAIVDHIGLNYVSSAGANPWAVSFFNAITAYGYLGLVVFILVLGACVAADLYVQMTSLPAMSEFKILKRREQRESLDAYWDYILDLRRLAYAYFRYKRITTSIPNLDLTVALLSRRLINRYVAAEPVQVKISGPIQGAGLKLVLSDLGKSVTLKPENLVQSDEGELTIAGDNAERGSLRPLDLPQQYEIVGEVATGGMGVVYRAKEKKTRQDLAIKVLRRQLETQPKQLERFEQEATTARTLQHPNIVIVYDSGVTSTSTAYIVMEWLDGRNLRNLLEEVRTLGLDRFLNIFLQAAGALAYSHQRNILHRDIKPSNIMLCSAGHTSDYVKIADFGIAKVLTPDAESLHLTQTGEIVGSPKYMSPEQCMGKDLDFRSDIYSLGCVMYEALVGAPPLDADNPGEMLYKHVSEMPARPTVVNPHLEMPNLVEPLLFKALQKDPFKRFQTMHELELALVQIKDSFRAQRAQSGPAPMQPS